MQVAFDIALNVVCDLVCIIPCFCCGAGLIIHTHSFHHVWFVRFCFFPRISSGGYVGRHLASLKPSLALAAEHTAKHMDAQGAARLQFGFLVITTSLLKRKKTIVVFIGILFNIHSVYW